MCAGLSRAVHDQRRLLDDLTASLADQTLPQRLRYYARFDLVIIDEFGFDRIERAKRPRRRACCTS